MNKICDFKQDSFFRIEDYNSEIISNLLYAHNRCKTLLLDSSVGNRDVYGAAFMRYAQRITKISQAILDHGNSLEQALTFQNNLIAAGMEVTELHVNKRIDRQQKRAELDRAYQETAKKIAALSEKLENIPFLTERGFFDDDPQQDGRAVAYILAQGVHLEHTVIHSVKEKALDWGKEVLCGDSGLLPQWNCIQAEMFFSDLPLISHFIDQKVISYFPEKTAESAQKQLADSFETLDRLDARPLGTSEEDEAQFIEDLSTIYDGARDHVTKKLGMYGIRSVTK